LSDDARRIARKQADFDAGRFRNVKYCEHHDEEVDHKGKCPACYIADEEYAEYDRDTRMLWNQR
jgi:hypothetical protein